MIVVDLYTIQIVRDDSATTEPPRSFEAYMVEVEENLTDLLPKGYSARIREWDNPGEDTE